MQLTPIKILIFAKEEAKNKHFHNIDYTIELDRNLVPKRHFVFGELRKVDWFSDPEMTDLVLTTEYVYTRNALGFAESRVSTRTWYMTNGEPHPRQKLRDKAYFINPQDQLDEIILKRTNNVRQINIALVYLVPLLSGGQVTSQQIIESGRAFFNANDLNRNTYVNEGASGLEAAVRTADETFSWMDISTAPLGMQGISTIRGYIIYQLSDGQRTE
jgi:hypothetical protein